MTVTLSYGSDSPFVLYMLTVVYRIYLKNGKNNWVQSVVFSVSWMISNG